jgi:5,6,7,8-tetrahydromethanopterin hydro-lyase
VRLDVGEGYAGEGAEAAHVNTLLGPRSGPVGAAFATALATPSAGHAPFLVVLRPGLAVKPPTLFVNKAAIAGEAHAALTWGAAQAGVAGGVADAVADGVVAASDADVLVLIAAVWVAPDARDAEAVYRNNRAATAAALTAGRARLPRLADVLAARARPENPFFRPRRYPGRPRRSAPAAASARTPIASRSAVSGARIPNRSGPGC